MGNSEGRILTKFVVVDSATIGIHPTAAEEFVTMREKSA
jgi:hypothetical protein